MRAIVENYLTIYYLNVMPSSNEEGEFRYYLYQMSGLNNRQKLGEPDKIEYKLKKEKEKQSIEDLEERIKKNSYFSSLPEPERKRLLKEKPARQFKWEKLIDISPLNNQFFKTTWKLNSNIAHSEFLGILQFKDVILSKKLSTLQNLVKLEIQFGCFVTAVLILDLIKLYKAAELVFNTLPSDLITKIRFFSMAGKKQNYPII
ncbi:MAG: hypothetical protein GC192_24080 [Bacteroidetes bacterium]|nr:hypothetical protein [Bacteroidota bacterium]